MQPVERSKNLTFDFETYHAHLSPFVHFYPSNFTLIFYPSKPFFYQTQINF